MFFSYMVEVFIIDEVIEELSVFGQVIEYILELMNEYQLVLLGYLFLEIFEVFMEQECEFIFFLVCVIWKFIFCVFGLQELVKEIYIFIVEDYNWGLLQDVISYCF